MCEALCFDRVTHCAICGTLARQRYVYALEGISWMDLTRFIVPMLVINDAGVEKFTIEIKNSSNGFSFGPEHDELLSVPLPESPLSRPVFVVHEQCLFLSSQRCDLAELWIALRTQWLHDPCTLGVRYPRHIAWPVHERWEDDHVLSWQVRSGEEWIAVNPQGPRARFPSLLIEHPGFDLERVSALGRRAAVPTPCRRDVFSRLPVEVRMCLLEQCAPKAVFALRAASPACAVVKMPQQFWFWKLEELWWLSRDIEEPSDSIDYEIVLRELTADEADTEVLKEMPYLYSRRRICDIVDYLESLLPRKRRVEGDHSSHLMKQKLKKNRDGKWCVVGRKGVEGVVFEVEGVVFEP
ncbi:hypothetical protein EDC01DRAFT_176771 [Geopyxis carbonaria]|nr:hypothetical protein EDC01DRAFT_176771 [Geopyxis carbonaria]